MKLKDFFTSILPNWPRSSRLPTDILQNQSFEPLWLTRDDDGNTPIILAATKGDSTALNNLLKAIFQSGASPEERLCSMIHVNNKGMSALMLATLQGHTKIVKILLKEMCSAGMTPEMLQAILNQTNHHDITVLMSAAIKGDAHMIRVLLSQFIRLEKQKELSNVLHFENNEGITALKSAVFYGQTDSIKAILAAMTEAGVKPNELLGKLKNAQADDPELMIAAIYGDITTITTYLKKSTPEQQFTLLIENNILTLLLRSTAKNTIELHNFIESLIDKGIPLKNEHMKKAGFNFDVEAYTRAKHRSNIFLRSTTLSNLRHLNTINTPSNNDCKEEPHSIHSITL